MLGTPFGYKGLWLGMGEFQKLILSDKFKRRLRLIVTSLEDVRLPEKSQLIHGPQINSMYVLCLLTYGTLIFPIGSVNR